MRYQVAKKDLLMFLLSDFGSAASILGRSVLFSMLGGSKRVVVDYSVLLGCIDSVPSDICVGYKGKKAFVPSHKVVVVD